MTGTLMLHLENSSNNISD